MRSRKTNKTIINNYLKYLLIFVFSIICSACSYGGKPQNGSTTAPDSKNFINFSINDIDATITNTTIGITLPYGSNVTSLVAKFEINGQKVTVGPTEQISGKTVNDFSKPVTYTVTAADGTTQNYTVTVIVAANDSKALTAFSINGVAGVIVGTNVGVTLPYGSSLNQLVAKFTDTGQIVKVGTTIEKSGYTVNDFSSPVTYTVVAADGSSQDYTVHVIISNNDSDNMTKFALNGIPGNIINTNIGVVLPYGSSLSSLIATFNDTGKSVEVDTVPQVSGRTINNFSQPVIYSVIAADSAEKNYTVTARIAENSAKAITSFSINGFPATIINNQIAITLPYGTNRANLIATFTTTGRKVTIDGDQQISGHSENDFTRPLIYQVTAEDGSTAEYTVTVIIAANSAKAITSFSINGVAGDIINNNIGITLPYNTNLTGLVAKFSTTGASVKIGQITQISGVNINNFTNPLTYTVIAADGSMASYTVTVTLAANSAKAITSFSINGVSGVINNNTIGITLPYGTSPAGLIAAFTTTGQQVTVNSKVQISGHTQNDFTNPLIYTVTAADGSTFDYTVKVTIALNSADSLLSFQVNGVSATIKNFNIGLTLPYGTNLTKLDPAFTTNGKEVFIGTTPQTSGHSIVDFSAPVTYTVEAANGDTANYTVQIKDAPSPSKQITSFKINGVSGVINNNTIGVTLPYGTNPSSLVAKFVTTGKQVSVNSVVQISGHTVNDFTHPVVYTVTAADGTTAQYTVVVKIALNSAKAIKSFSINGINGTIFGLNINLTLPYGTDRSKLIATFTTTGSTVFIGNTVQVSGTTQNDFTSLVKYIVYAADGSSNIYTVNVVDALNPAKAMTAFAIGQNQGTINGTDITVHVPYSSDLTNLIATFSTTGQTVTVGSTVQISGQTINDFSNSPVIYKVTAADGSFTNYSVTIIKDAQPLITQFSIDGVTGTITGSSISISLPYGTNPSDLIANFSTTGENVYVGSTLQVSGTSQNDFTNPVNYNVVDADGGVSSYTVTVTILQPSIKQTIVGTLLPGGNAGLFYNGSTTYVVDGTINTGSNGTVLYWDTTQSSINSFNVDSRNNILFAGTDPAQSNTWFWAANKASVGGSINATNFNGSLIYTNKFNTSNYPTGPFAPFGSQVYYADNHENIYKAFYLSDEDSDNDQVWDGDYNVTALATTNGGNSVDAAWNGEIHYMTYNSGYGDLLDQGSIVSANNVHSMTINNGSLYYGTDSTLCSINYQGGTNNCVSNNINVVSLQYNASQNYLLILDSSNNVYSVIPNADGSLANRSLTYLFKVASGGTGSVLYDSRAQASYVVSGGNIYVVK